MKEITGKTKKGREIVSHTFDRLDDLWNFVNAPVEQQKTFVWEKKDSTGGKDWLFEDTYFRGELKSKEEVEQFLVYGWEQPMQRIKEQISKNIKDLQQERKHISYKSDVVGYTPIVANALMGLPKSMLNMVVSTKKQRVVHFLLELSYPHFTRQTEVQDFFSKFIAYVHKLELEGYRCRIETISVFANEDESKMIPMMKMCVKSEMQPMDLKRMSFVLAHIGFFRTVSFMWYSCFNRPLEQYKTWGMGVPIHRWDKKNQEEVLDFIKGNTNNNVVYVPFNGDLEKIFKKGGEAYGEKS